MPATRPDGASLVWLTYHSPLREVEATTDATPPLSLTPHSYFKFAGDDVGDIAQHALLIHADDYSPADAATLAGKVVVSTK